MPQEDEWISAREALALLAMPLDGERTICTYAHAGLVKARAKRYMNNAENGSPLYGPYELPRSFWWPEGAKDLIQKWDIGYFEWTDHETVRHKALGVEFRRSEIAAIRPAEVATDSLAPTPPAGTYVFIGHGHSPLWRELKEFLQDTLKLAVEEFNSVSPAGKATKERLKEMLDASRFAFLVMTAEDEQPDGKFRARSNVIHEVGLFQGRLGFERAIVLLEKGCDDFSNIDGLTHIAFEKGNVKAAFEDIRGVLKREKLI